MNIAAVDLNLLVAFEALIEERSVTRAARRIGLSQPAMSAALGRLRGLFEDALFRRTPRGIEPTTRAHELAGPIRAALSQIRRALEGETAFEPARSERAFRLAMTDYSEWLVLPNLMRLLDHEAPGVKLHVRRLERLFEPPDSDLSAGTVDLAIGFFGDARTLADGLRGETLLEERNVVIWRRKKAKHSHALTLDNFAAARHAAIIYRPEPWGLIDQQLAVVGRKRKLHLAVPNFHTVVETVAASSLIACVPERLAARYAPELQLEVAEAPIEMPPFHTRMVWHQSLASDAGLTWLRASVRRSVS